MIGQGGQISMELTVFITIMLTIATTCAILAIGLAAFAAVKVLALEKSTHAIEYVPADPSWASSPKDMEKAAKPLPESDFPEVDHEDPELADVDLSKLI